jgi:hypothetical protein
MIPAVFQRLNYKQHMKNQIMKHVLNAAFLITLLAALTETVSAKGSPLATPDAGSTACLMGIACAGLVMARRFRR